MAARQVEGLQFERVADELLAVKPATLESHALNQSAAAVFDLCDGKASKSEMAAEIQRRTGLPADEEIVELALAELVDAGLIAGGRSGTAVQHFPAVVGSATLAVGSGRDDASGRGDHPPTARGCAGVSHDDIDLDLDDTAHDLEHDHDLDEHDDAHDDDEGPQPHADTALTARGRRLDARIIEG